MTYKDPETLLKVCHYGFSTGWGSEGDWIFPGEGFLPVVQLTLRYCNFMTSNFNR